ncbi:hypothetical protein OLMES_3765 [Oleiphilus messinensis]|uniref:DUF2971 domain-containing protein n=1 Tax=Oleiphilus messinensis TaxID=141451 RepID=A0A1Y0IDD7_9GAMM|nr:DUF2971 domain-containing protein [Oleiphilus messinensis]ARU57786.1 hypothetical protein OLMES_3765 [Oleiphilus messinensis]
MIKEITNQLYSHTPSERLYHYTSFSGLRGIVESNAIWASDIRYMNDSAELRHTSDLIRQEVNRRIVEDGSKTVLLNQFVDWVARRITNGHILFGASFRSNGNLLSQWRGYSALGKGVSVGFSPEHIVQSAQRQQFQVGRCIYDEDEQRELISKVIIAVEALARDNLNVQSATDECFANLFNRIESDLLRIAAILKHPSFQEEEEWRIVSPVVTDYLNSPVRFREGVSMLVPYIEFNLMRLDTRRIAIDHIYLGPTPNIDLSMNSLEMYLSSQGAQPASGIHYCQIPYRQR